MKLGIYNRVAGLPTHANWCGAATTWVVWTNMWNNTCSGFLGIPFLIFALFTLLFGSRPARKRGPILTIYTSYDVLPPKDVPFGVLFILISILGVKSKIWHTDVLQPSWASQPLKFEIFKIQDDSGRHLETNRKSAISLERFDRCSRNMAWWRILGLRTGTEVEISHLKIQDGGRPPSWIIEKLPYLSRGLSDFDKIWHTDAVRPSWASQPLKIWNFQNPRWRRPPSWKIVKIGHISGPSRNLARWRTLGLRTGPEVKIHNF